MDRNGRHVAEPLVFGRWTIWVPNTLCPLPPSISSGNLSISTQHPSQHLGGTGNLGRPHVLSVYLLYLETPQNNHPTP